MKANQRFSIIRFNKQMKGGKEKWKEKNLWLLH